MYIMSNLFHCEKNCYFNFQYSDKMSQSVIHAAWQKIMIFTMKLMAKAKA